MTDLRYTTLRIEKELLQELRMAKARITNQINGERFNNSDIIKIVITLIKENPELAITYLNKSLQKHNS